MLELEHLSSTVSRALFEKHIVVIFNNYIIIYIVVYTNPYSAIFIGVLSMQIGLP